MKRQQLEDKIQLFYRSEGEQMKQIFDELPEYIQTPLILNVIRFYNDSSVRERFYITITDHIISTKI
jgi:hypothetical protein